MTEREELSSEWEELVSNLGRLSAILRYPKSPVTAEELHYWSANSEDLRARLHRLANRTYQFVAKSTVKK